MHDRNAFYLYHSLIVDSWDQVNEFEEVHQEIGINRTKMEWHQHFE